MPRKASEIRNKLLALTSLRYKTLPLLLENMAVSDDLKPDDPVTRIIKTHLLSEVVIDKLIELCFDPNGVALLAADLRYRQKLEIVAKAKLAVDVELLPDFVIGSLRKLNAIRNRLAHQLGATVSNAEAVELFMGVEHPMPFDKKKADVGLILYHYTSFLFGYMLPKYE